MPQNGTQAVIFGNVTFGGTGIVTLGAVTFGGRGVVIFGAVTLGAVTFGGRGVVIFGGGIVTFVVGGIVVTVVPPRQSPAALQVPDGQYELDEGILHSLPTGATHQSPLLQ